MEHKKWLTDRQNWNERKRMCEVGQMFPLSNQLNVAVSGDSSFVDPINEKYIFCSFNDLFSLIPVSFTDDTGLFQITAKPLSDTGLSKKRIMFRYGINLLRNHDTSKWFEIDIPKNKPEKPYQINRNNELNEGFFNKKRYLHLSLCLIFCMLLTEREIEGLQDTLLTENQKIIRNDSKIEKIYIDAINRQYLENVLYEDLRREFCMIHKEKSLTYLFSKIEDSSEEFAFFYANFLLSEGIQNFTEDTFETYNQISDLMNKQVAYIDASDKKISVSQAISEREKIISEANLLGPQKKCYFEEYSSLFDKAAAYSNRAIYGHMFREMVSFLSFLLGKENLEELLKRRISPFFLYYLEKADFIDNEEKASIENGKMGLKRFLEGLNNKNCSPCLVELISPDVFLEVLVKISQPIDHEFLKNTKKIKEENDVISEKINSEFPNDPRVHELFNEFTYFRKKWSNKLLDQYKIYTPVQLTIEKKFYRRFKKLYK